MADLNDDITRYLSGRMTAAEMHALEKKALDDPFLADALSGGESIPVDEFSEDVSSIHDMLKGRIRKEPTGGILEGSATPGGKQTSLWSWPTRVAAGLLLVASASIVVYFISEKRTDELALNTPKPASNDAADADQISTDTVQGFQEAARLRSEEPAASTEEDASKRKEQGRAAQSRAEEKQEPTKDTPAAEPWAGRTPGVAVSPAPTDAVAEAADGEPNDTPEVATKAEEQLPQPAKRSAAEDVARREAEVAKPEVVSPSDGYAKSSDIASAQKRHAFKNSETPSPAAAEENTNTASDKKVFTGKVVDADGVGIPGVNVVIKGTNTGTVTDINGNYQLANDETNPTLVYTFIGYANVEAVADPSKPATVTLDEDHTELSEVVVAGYGSGRTTNPLEATYDFAYPAGGRRAFKKYLEKNLQYPREALLNNVEGRVTVTFTVEPTGALSNFRVVRGIGSGCDEEVIRLIKQGPKWTPTKRDDVAEKSVIKVRMRFQLPKKNKN